jgi:hypothetical protein
MRLNRDIQRAIDGCTDGAALRLYTHSLQRALVERDARWTAAQVVATRAILCAVVARIDAMDECADCAVCDMSACPHTARDGEYMTGQTGDNR